MSAPPRGALGVITSADHKVVGLLLMGSCLCFFLAGGVMALTMRSELAQPGLQLIGIEHYNELFSMHGSTMVFLVMTPLAMALGVYLVPLQIGAANLAAPRLNVFALWTLVLGGLVMYSGFLTAHGTTQDGWWGAPPLSNETYSPGLGQDAWFVGVILTLSAIEVLAVTVLATAVFRRAPGMTMLRMPVFTWTAVVTCLMVIFSFPSFILASAMMLVDRHSSYTIDPVLYLHLFWFYGHPVVYVMFFPFVGAAAEAISVFSSKRWFGYRPMVVSLIAFSVLSMTVWAHHMFTTGQVVNEYFALTSTALAIVAGIEYFDAFATMWGGSLRLTASMLFALGFFFQFLIGGLTGIIVASPPLDYHVNDSYFVVAHFHYTLFAGSLFGGFAGVYLWFPKISGRMLREGLGKLQFWVLVLGTNLTFFPMFFLGYDGMPRRIANYPSDAGWTGLNTLATAGSFVIALGIVVFLVNVAVSLLRPRVAGPDPWQGMSLEWATSSPPPRHNFDWLPPIESYAPLLDLRERQQDVGTPPSAQARPAVAGGAPP